VLKFSLGGKISSLKGPFSPTRKAKLHFSCHKGSFPKEEKWSSLALKGKGKGESFTNFSDRLRGSKAAKIARLGAPYLPLLRTKG